MAKGAVGVAGAGSIANTLACGGNKGGTGPGPLLPQVPQDVIIHVYNLSSGKARDVVVPMYLNQDNTISSNSLGTQHNTFSIRLPHGTVIGKHCARTTTGSATIKPSQTELDAFVADKPEYNATLQQYGVASKDFAGKSHELTAKQEDTDQTGPEGLIEKVYADFSDAARIPNTDFKCCNITWMGRTTAKTDLKGGYGSSSAMAVGGIGYYILNVEVIGPNYIALLGRAIEETYETTCGGEDVNGSTMKYLLEGIFKYSEKGIYAINYGLVMQAT